MENGPKYTLIGSGVVVVISVILFVFGSTVDVDVESEAVFKGTEGTVELSDQTTYTVFVNADSDCYDAEIVVTDGTCLLYTSPSPRDLSTSRMPSSA